MPGKKGERPGVEIPAILKDTGAEHDYLIALKQAKVPLLILDQKWHHLFSDAGKPEQIQRLEERVNGLLLRQSHIQQEIKDLKKLKVTLMDNIVANMDGAEGKDKRQVKKLVADRRLIAEINGKLEAYEDEQVDLPALMKETNEELMAKSMEYCYDKLRVNSKDIEEIGEWIKDIRIELKKQVIRKQTAELKNREIYSYMHDIFGPRVIDLFDMQFQPAEEKSVWGNTEPDE